MVIMPFWVGDCLKELRVAIPMVDALDVVGSISSSVPTMKTMPTSKRWRFLCRIVEYVRNPTWLFMFVVS